MLEMEVMVAVAMMLVVVVMVGHDHYDDTSDSGGGGGGVVVMMDYSDGGDGELNLIIEQHLNSYKLTWVDKDKKMVIQKCLGTSPFVIPRTKFSAKNISMDVVHILVNREFQKMEKIMLAPVVEALAPIANITVESQDLQKIFQVFVGQLRLLFGLRSNHLDATEMGVSRFLNSERGFTEWIRLRIYLKWFVEVQSLPRMIIMDEIGKQVKYSLEAASLALRNASLGIYDASAGVLFTAQDSGRKLNPKHIQLKAEVGFLGVMAKECLIP
ncbi:hypothetical protein COCNU_11G001880 [Cocos nucifera]|uniref:Uncharacterized protein n=1 Tax=Cocos nucifera TaxID=13894 RepID=A0A8K0IN75_COCNU|nr:hypothetical protein COCNU_11G001880 [Cocos nucifera]